MGLPSSAGRFFSAGVRNNIHIHRIHREGGKQVLALLKK